MSRKACSLLGCGFGLGLLLAMMAANGGSAFAQGQGNVHRGFGTSIGGLTIGLGSYRGSRRSARRAPRRPTKDLADQPKEDSDKAKPASSRTRRR